MAESGISRRTYPLLLNVAVNLIANLLSIAIIYLGGVAIGLFPSDPELMVVVGIFIFAIGNLVLALFERVFTVGFMWVVAIAALCLVLALGTAVDLAVSRSAVFAHLSIIVCAALFFTGLMWAARGAYSDMRSEFKGKRRINGLHWIGSPSEPQEGPDAQMYAMWW
jgi:hypothetical protein